MLRGRCSSTHSDRPTTSPASQSPVSPIIPAHTQIQGAGRTSELSTFNFQPLLSPLATPFPTFYFHFSIFAFIATRHSSLITAFSRIFRTPFQLSLVFSITYKIRTEKTGGGGPPVQDRPHELRKRLLQSLGNSRFGQRPHEIVSVLVRVHTVRAQLRLQAAFDVGHAGIVVHIDE